MTNQNFISPAVSHNSLTGADILAMEGAFLKQMLVVFDYYKENPPADLAVAEQLDTVTNFLKHDLHIFEELDQCQFFNWDSMKNCLKAYGHYLANWDEAPVDFKTLFNFLTRSSAEGPHREALDAYQKLSADFLVNNYAKEISI